MKRKPRITGFAKLVIAVLIFFGLRYAYIHREEILSADFLNLSDSTEITNIKEDTVFTPNEKDSLSFIDTVKGEGVDIDTLDIIFERSENMLMLITSGDTSKFLLNDTGKLKDTTPFNVFEDKNIFGRVIIK